jgi:hypothetical protein
LAAANWQCMQAPHCSVSGVANGDNSVVQYIDSKLMSSIVFPSLHKTPQHKNLRINPYSMQFHQVTNAKVWFCTEDRVSILI